MNQYTRIQCIKFIKKKLKKILIKSSKLGQSLHNKQENEIWNFLSDMTYYARRRKNWLKGEHIHQNSEPTTLFESDHTNSHSYPRLLKF